jgi:hypothetical protein
MQEGNRRKKIYRYLGWSLFASILLVIIGFCLYGSAGRDDAHITYWPAYTLAHMGKIINYNGEVVEQSSSLLQVVLLASFHVASGVDIVTLGRLVSILFGVLSLLLTYILASRFHTKAGPAAALATSLCGSFVYWSFGGLETTLTAFCTLWLLLKFDDILNSQPVSYFEWGHVSIATLAFITVRPEMPIVLGCIVLGTATILFWKSLWAQVKGKLLFLTMLVILIVLSLFSVRYFTFGHFFPLPVSAKSSSFSAEQATNGLRYIYGLLRSPSGLETGITPIGLFGITAFFCSLFHAYRNIFQYREDTQSLVFTLSICFSLSYISFIVLSGGDWMEAGRFIVPMVPIASVFVVSTIYIYFMSWSKYIVLFGIFMLTLSTNVNIVENQSTGVSNLHRESYRKDLKNALTNRKIPYDTYSWFEKYNKVHARDLVSIQKLSSIIRSHSKSDGLNILSGQMGIVMYHLNKKYRENIEVIDNYNLTTNKISKCAPEDVNVGRSGSHVRILEIINNIGYYEDRCNIDKPDIIYHLQGEYDELLRDRGYIDIYRQEGYMSLEHEYMEGSTVTSDQFIMISKSLYKQIGDVKNDNIVYLYQDK